jgi:hypothetical protein
MAKVNDLLEDSDGDILIVNGDLTIGESDNTHISDVIVANKGDWKEYPLLGVGINAYLNSSGMQQFVTNEIKKQLDSDGYGSISVIFNNDNFEVDAIRG